MKYVALFADMFTIETATDNGVDAGTAWEDVPRIGYALSVV